jgi:pimeloyl-ACP methyl ester carboxylesterase
MSNTTKKQKIESGIFNNKVPYVKVTAGPDLIIVIDSSNDLMSSLLKDPASRKKQYGMLIPPEYSFYVLGFNPDMPEGYTKEKMCDDFAEVIKTIEKETKPIAILSGSFGGLVAITFAAKYPELTRKLVLISTAHKNNESGISIIKKSIELSKAGKFLEVQKMAEGMCKRWIYNFMMKMMMTLQKKKILANWNPASTVIIGYSDVLRTFDTLKNYLPQIKAPTLIFGAGRDQFFSTEAYEETAKLIPNAKLKFFPEETHMILIERNKDIKKAIKEFLAQ